MFAETFYISLQTRDEMGSPHGGAPPGGGGPTGLASPSASLETDIEAAARLAPLAGFLTGRDCPWFTLPCHHDLLR